MEFNVKNTKNSFYEYLYLCETSADRIMMIIKRLVSIPEFEIKLNLVTNISITALYIREILNLYESILQEHKKNKNIYKLDIIAIYPRLFKLQRSLKSVHYESHQYKDKLKNCTNNIKKEVDHYFYIKEIDLKETFIDLLSRDINLVKINQTCYTGLRNTYYFLRKIEKALEKVYYIILTIKANTNNSEIIKFSDNFFLKEWKCKINDSEYIIEESKYNLLFNN
jgi:hypothetical protein